MRRVRRAGFAARWGFYGLICLLAVAAAGCADRTPGKYVRVLAPSELERLKGWRVSMAVIIAVQCFIMIVAARRLGTASRAAHVVRALVFAPLVWTKLGEWWYRLWRWAIDQGPWGILVMALLSAMTGIIGTGNVALLLLAGFIFLDYDVLSYGVLPSLMAATLVDLGVLAAMVTNGQAGGQRWRP